MIDDYEYILQRYIQGKHFSGRSFIFSDRDPGDILGEEIERREVLYTKLLQDYSSITKKRNSLKEIHKWVFFWIIMIAGGIVSYFCYKVISRVLAIKETEQFIKSFPVIATVFISFLSTIVGIPLTITKFLFNAQEDENITHTIQCTQAHDFEEVKLLKERYTGHKRKTKQKKYEKDEDYNKK
ncbi:MAG: hypothetical protein IJV85_00270 [Clostridia bacterium]|nr:hypothetical protein [Clostridia bacterium]